MHTNHIHVCISNYMAGNIPAVTKLDIVYKQVYQMYGFDRKDIKTKSKERHLVHARHAFCYLARKCAKMKFTDISKELGRDHTTIIAAVKSMEDKMTTDFENSRDQMNRMIENLKFAF